MVLEKTDFIVSSDSIQCNDLKVEYVNTIGFFLIQKEFILGNMYEEHVIHISTKQAENLRNKLNDLLGEQET